MNATQTVTAAVMMLAAAVVILLAMNGCRAFENQPGQPTREGTAEKASRAAVETGRQLQQTATDSPTLNALTGGVLPLAGEILIALGLGGLGVLERIRRGQAEDTIREATVEGEPIKVSSPKAKKTLARVNT